MNYHKYSRRSEDRGLTLPTVLLSLILIGTISAVASGYGLNSSRELAIAARNSEKNQDRINLVNLALAYISNYGIPEERMLALPIKGSDVMLGFQDVSGLVDLNTSSHSLMYALLLGLGVDKVLAIEILKRRSDYRSSGFRFSGALEFSLVTDFPGENLDLLNRISTVYSGQSGFSRQAAPNELVELLDVSTKLESDEYRFSLNDIDIDPSNLNFRVMILNQKVPFESIGIIHTGGLSGKGKILALN